MKRSVPMARSGKLKSAHWSSQDDYRFGNQSPGKWQKKQSLFSLGNRMLRLYSPWQGFSPPITAGLRISSWSLFLLAPLLIVSSLVWPTAYDIFMRSLSQPASLSLFFFFFFSLPLLSAQQSKGYSLLHGLFSKDCYLYIKSILQKPMLKIRVGKISFLHSFLKEPHPKTPALSETDC